MGVGRVENKGDRRREEPGADASEGVLLEHLSADLQEERDACRGEQRECRAAVGSHQANHSRIKANHQGRQEESAGGEELAPRITTILLVTAAECRKSRAAKLHGINIKKT